jgi:hypothetical protein
MRGFSFGLLAPGTIMATLLAVASAQAQDRTQLNQDIAEMAKIHKVPERLIHRIIVRESRYNARAQHAGNYGLMQIKPATARGMGYRGSPAGLLVAKTNLTYGVPYLANAYRVAGGNEDRAVQLYAGGYYYAAKRKGMLGKLTSAHTSTAAAEAPPQAAAATVVSATAPPVEAQAYAAPVSPFEALASLFAPPPEPQPVAAPEPQVEQSAAEQPRKPDGRRHRKAAAATRPPQAATTTLPQAAAATVVPPSAPPVEAQAFAAPASPFGTLGPAIVPPPAPKPAAAP